MTDIIVAFPEPCTETWGAMSPRGCDRHCASCDKIVHDLASLSVEEAESLLDNNAEICVRAQITAEGSVRTATGISASSRRIVTTIGASLALAAAGCQTSGPPRISPRFEVKGHVGDGWASQATLISSDGKTRSKILRSDQNFRFTNLRPGNYTLSFIGTCEEQHRIENIVIKDDIDLGDIKFSGEANDCIIIGRMERKSETRQG